MRVSLDLLAYILILKRNSVDPVWFTCLPSDQQMFDVIRNSDSLGWVKIIIVILGIRPCNLLSLPVKGRSFARGIYKGKRGVT